MAAIVDTRDEHGLRTWRIQFENLDDVQSWIKATPRRWGVTSSERPSYGQSWDLGCEFDQAMEFARTGWIDGVVDISGRLAMRPPHLTNDPKWRYDVAGELPDIGRFLAGDPAHMMRHGHPKGHRPVITLATGANGSAGVTASQLRNYGAAMVAIIDQLESTGRRVEAYATFVSSKFGQGRLAPVWRVKAAEDVVDLSALAFSLSHPAAFRRLGFAIYERSGFSTWNDYGSSVTSTLEDLIDPAPNTLVISGLAGSGARCNTLEGAIEYAAEQINQAAGEVLVTVEG